MVRAPNSHSRLGVDWERIYECKSLKKRCFTRMFPPGIYFGETQRSNPPLVTKCDKTQRSKLTPDSLRIACPMRTFPYF